jgi:hypothetical protein
LSRAADFDHEDQQNEKEPQQQTMKPVANSIQEDRNDDQTTNICSKA